MAAGVWMCCLVVCVCGCLFTWAAGGWHVPCKLTFCMCGTWCMVFPAHAMQCAAISLFCLYFCFQMELFLPQTGQGCCAWKLLSWCFPWFRAELISLHTTETLGWQVWDGNTTSQQAIICLHVCGDRVLFIIFFFFSAMLVAWLYGWGRLNPG